MNSFKSVRHTEMSDSSLGAAPVTHTKRSNRETDGELMSEAHLLSFYSFFEIHREISFGATNISRYIIV